MFVKCEKQLYDGEKAPKNRCICGPNDLHKYVMGPVTWALESRFKHFPGYCGGKNWEELEDLYKYWDLCGFVNVLQLDGSGFDRTQHTCIKRIVDQQIYKIAERFVTHVPIELYAKFAYMEKRKVRCSHRQNKRFYNDGYFTQDGSVFSGSCDTTLMNTIRMAMYNRFVNEELLGFTYGFQYEVIAKGDDTAAVYKQMIPKSRVEEAYKQVFVMGGKPEQWVDMKYGLGQVAKYFKWGNIESIDFCSTETIYCPSIDSYKIIRQLPRFFTLTAWSTKIYKYQSMFGAEGIKLYLESLYQSNLKWMCNIPILRAYNYLLHRDCRGIQYKTRQGTKKMIITEYQDLNDLNLDEEDYHKNKMRTSTKYAHERDYYDYFLRKYGISVCDIAKIEQDILNTPYDGKIDCPLLESALGLL